uniref:uncharacterized protein n=1 Tax=Semicossyphus pulcher TaxID=241346 RepID=UPI0037E8FF1C
MSTYTKRRHNPQGQYNFAEIRDNIYTHSQHAVVPGRRADRADQPFPNKPVSHRRPNNPKSQDSLDLNDFGKIAVTKQPRGPLSTQDHHSYGTEITVSHHPRKDSHRLPSGELQMSRAIHEKQLMLQKKLWRVEEKVRQKIHRASDDAAESDDYIRGQAEMQRRREPMRSREVMIQDRRQEDVKQHMRRSEQADLSLTASTGVGLQLLPCRICNRKFASERLEKHVLICEKGKHSHRQVFNSFVNRTKGSDLGEYLKTHSRSKTPEVLKKKKQIQNKANTRNPQGGGLPAQTLQPKRFK